MLTVFDVLNSIADEDKASTVVDNENDPQGTFQKLYTAMNGARGPRCNVKHVVMGTDVGKAFEVHTQMSAYGGTVDSFSADGKTVTIDGTVYNWGDVFENFGANSADYNVFALPVQAMWDFMLENMLELLSDMADGDNICTIAESMIAITSEHFGHDENAVKAMLMSVSI